MSLLALGGAALAGLLSFLSPCVLPLAPAYLARLAGPQAVASPATGVSASRPPRARTLAHAAAFVLGFGLVFVALGATASVLGQALARQAPLLRTVGGAALVLFGLHVAGVLPLPALLRTWQLRRAPAGPSYLASLAIGGVFGLGWMPCVGPVLAGVLVLAAQSATLATGVALLTAYALGLGVPFLALGAAFEVVAPRLRIAAARARLVAALSGALLVAMGLAVLFNWLVLVSSRFALLPPPVVR